MILCFVEYNMNKFTPLFFLLLFGLPVFISASVDDTEFSNSVRIGIMEEQAKKQRTRSLKNWKEAEKTATVQNLPKANFVIDILYFIIGGWSIFISAYFAFFVFGAMPSWIMNNENSKKICKQCEKIADYSICPSGKQVVWDDKEDSESSSSLLRTMWQNQNWITVLFFYALGVVFYMTVIGIPLGRIYFKMAKLLWMPFSARIVKPEA